MSIKRIAWRECLVIASLMIGLLVCTSIPATAGSIGLSFNGYWGRVLQPTIEAGVVKQTNWNNTLRYQYMMSTSGVTEAFDKTSIFQGGNSDAPVGLGTIVDDTGTVVNNLDIRWTHGLNHFGGSSSNGDIQLMKALTYQYRTTDPTMNIEVQDIPYAAYDLYVYLGGEDGTQSTSDSAPNIAKVWLDGNPDAFYFQSEPHVGSPGFVQTTHTTGAAGAPLASYAVWTGLTGDDVTISFVKEAGSTQHGFSRIGIPGIQIVEVPEPGSIGLASLGLLSLLMFIRRRRAA